jgi:PAS domain S-box-containing protein
VRILLLALVYVGTGQLGLALAIAPGLAPLVWPPAGIAIGALLLFGRGLWPGVLIGSFVVRIIIGIELVPEHQRAVLMLAAAIGAAGSTLQALVTAKLVADAVAVPLRMHGWNDAGKLFILTVPIGCLIEPTALVAAAFASAAPTTQLWMSWWRADMFGVIVFLPLMLLSSRAATTTAWRGRSLGVLSLPALIALLIPITVAFYAWNVSRQLLREKTVAEFTALAKESEKALQYRIQLYEQALRAGAGFWLGSDSVSRSEWRAFCSVMDMDRNYPGMRGLGWITAVPSAEIAQFEAVMKREAPAFKLGAIGQQQHNFIITYIEPETGNGPAIGFNIASEANRRQAALTAMQTGKPTMTRHVRLVQDTVQRSGFLLLLPVSKPSSFAPGTDFQGWVYAPLVGEDFIAELTYAQDKLFRLRIFEGDESATNLIHADKASPHHAAAFVVRDTLEVGQQPWRLIWESTPEFEAASLSREPALILTIGLLSSAIFGALMLISARREQEIEALVQERTRQLGASQEALQASAATLRAAMEHAAIGMALSDVSGTWRQANRALCELLGYSVDELRATDARNFIHPDDLDKDAQLLQQTLAGQRQSYQIEKRYFHKDGHVIWTLLTVALVRDAQERPQYFVAQIQDISQRHEMDRLKNEFISTVSHELRTPLTAIRGSLGLLASGSVGELPPKAQSMMRIAHSNSERLVRIINDILDIEKIESGRLELAMARVPLAALLSQSLDSNQAYASKYSVALRLCDVPQDLHVNADPDRLMQIMANLLSNGAKFSPPNAEVIVRVVVEAESAIIEVHDHGPGIPDSFGNRIFEKFVQVDSSSSRRFEGTGLGLSITKQLVEAMGGRIAFTSKVGEGATFRVWLRR